MRGLLSGLSLLLVLAVVGVVAMKQLKGLPGAAGVATAGAASSAPFVLSPSQARAVQEQVKADLNKAAEQSAARLEQADK